MSNPFETDPTTLLARIERVEERLAREKRESNLLWICFCVGLAVSVLVRLFF